MKVRHDPEADALYIRFSDADVAQTSEVRPDVMFDYDGKGRIVGIEILNASKNISSPAIT
jgi:uncharacterized protein YuzE